MPDSFSCGDSSQSAVARGFSRAAKNYDHVAMVQEQVAAQLVEYAASIPKKPKRILDIGCGTGFAALQAARRWPDAEIAAIDAAPSMLEQARTKLPGLQINPGNAAAMDFAPQFDAIFSSMALHWIENPRAALARWRSWLTPGGTMHVALPVEGSFREWRELCAHEGMADGLWPLPREDFADGLAFARTRQRIEAEYPSARDFLRHLKTAGAATPRIGHRPLPIPALRRMLAYAPTPFTVGYEMLYLMPASPQGAPIAAKLN